MLLLKKVKILTKMIKLLISRKNNMKFVIFLIVIIGSSCNYFSNETKIKKIRDIWEIKEQRELIKKDSINILISSNFIENFEKETGFRLKLSSIFKVNFQGDTFKVFFYHGEVVSGTAIILIVDNNNKPIGYLEYSPDNPGFERIVSF